MSHILSGLMLLAMASTLVVGNLEELELPNSVQEMVGHGKPTGENIYSGGVLRRAGGVDGPLAGRLVVVQSPEPQYLRPVYYRQEVKDALAERSNWLLYGSRGLPYGDSGDPSLPSGQAIQRHLEAIQGPHGPLEEIKEACDELGNGSGYVLEAPPGGGTDSTLAASSEGEGAVRELSDRSGWVRGEATYYHRSLSGDLMRDGVTRYDSQASGVVAAVSWPLGSLLYVCGPTGRCLQAVVSDTGLLKQWQTDWSEADFTVLAGSLGPGRVEVSVREVQEP